eukprot:768422-Hanusia_phi.AAC.2
MAVSSLENDQLIDQRSASQRGQFGSKTFRLNLDTITGIYKILINAKQTRPSAMLETELNFEIICFGKLSRYLHGIVSQRHLQTTNDLTWSATCAARSSRIYLRYLSSRHNSQLQHHGATDVRSDLGWGPGLDQELTGQCRRTSKLPSRHDCLGGKCANHPQLASSLLSPSPAISLVTLRTASPSSSILLSASPVR